MSARTEAMRIAGELDGAGVPDAAFESELLVREAGGLSRAAYFAGSELEAQQRARLHQLAQRRANREPFAYITGRREFYGLEFEVGPAVLIPRPETELLVEVALKELAEQPWALVADIGAGSGCIAVSVAKHAPAAAIVAADASHEALTLARRNAERLHAKVGFVRGNLAQPLARADVIVANLPYIPSAEAARLEPEIRDWEPRSALDGGPDGLDLVRELVADCATRLRPRLLALEVGLGQAQTVAALGRTLGANAEVLPDLAGIDRVVCLRWA